MLTLAVKSSELQIIVIHDVNLFSGKCLLLVFRDIIIQNKLKDVK